MLRSKKSPDICKRAKVTKNLQIDEYLTSVWVFLTKSIAIDKATILEIASLSEGVFWATDVNRKWGLDDKIYLLLRPFFTIIETIWLEIRAKPSPENEQKRSLPVDVRRP